MTYFVSYFFYNIIGDYMKIYVDLVLLLNFLFDLILLFGVALLLRRQTTLKRLLMGALVGSVTIFSMFIEMGSLGLFFIKILISILMVLIVFGYNNIFKFIPYPFFFFSNFEFFL